MPHRVRTAVQTDPRSGGGLQAGDDRRQYSLTAYGRGVEQPTEEDESFKARMARQNALHLSLPHPLHARAKVSGAEDGLRRKTPSGIVAGGYDGNTAPLESQPIKHLIMCAAQSAASSDARLGLEFSGTGRCSSTTLPQTSQKTPTGLHPVQFSAPAHPNITYGSTRLGFHAHNKPHGTSEANLDVPSRQVASSFTSWVPASYGSQAPFHLPSTHHHQHTSHIHEPPMNFLNEHINELTLHDFPGPSENPPPPYAYCQDASLAASLLPSSRPNWQAPRLPLRNSLQQPNFAHETKRATTSNGMLGPQFSNGANGIHGSLQSGVQLPSGQDFSYPDHVISRANALYAAMVNTAQQLRRQSNPGESSSSSSQSSSSYMYPRATRRLSGSKSLTTAQAHSLATGNNLSLLGDDSHMRSDHQHHMDYSRAPLANASSRHSPYAAQPSWGPISALPPADNMNMVFLNPSACYAQPPVARPQQTFPPFGSPSDLGNAAWATYVELTQLCAHLKSNCTDTMLLAGCLAFALGRYSDASTWFSKVVSKETCHIAFSNLALTALACKSFPEAERYWQSALKISPCYVEAAEHLVGLLCSQRRQQRAIEVIDHVMHSFRVKNGSITNQHYFPAAGRNLPVQNIYGASWDDVNSTQLLGLLHAKGNMLYGLQDHIGAAKAFEETVLLALGMERASLADLVQLILSRLPSQASSNEASTTQPLLLRPDEALHTARICFGSHKSLSGLNSIRDRQAQKSAMSTTSNSLLSLAKIFQDGMISRNYAHEQPGVHFGVREILALYYLSLSLQPSPSTANNVGILLASVPTAFHQAHSNQDAARMKCAFPGVPIGNGVHLALQYYNYGLSLDSKHAHLYTNLGSLLKDIGQLAEAIKMYERAVVCDPFFDIALANLANAVKDQGKVDEAIVYYKRAVKANPNFVEAVCGLANALTSICNWVGRGGAYLNGGHFDRWHVMPDGVISDVRLTRHGSGWIQRVIDVVDKQLADGEAWGTGALSLEQMEDMIRPIFHLGPYEESQFLDRAYQWSGGNSQGAKAVRLLERVVRRVGWQWYQDKYVKRREKPLVAYSRPQFPTQLTSPSSPTVLPFHTFTLPLTARQIRLISQRNGLRVSYQTLRSTWLPSTVLPPPPPPDPQLNIGYVSSDFNNHPLAHLMQNVFGMHDPARVRVFCYATTPSDNSIHRKKIEDEAPFFFDASGWSVERHVRQILQDKIHILINLNGYTRGARNEVFAARPAPIQMSFMGFAGSLGAEWCDYLLADETAIPQSALRPYRNNVDLEDLLVDDNHSDTDSGWMYGENIIYTRDPFFCCDHRQSGPGADEPRGGWEDEQARRWRMRRELFPRLPPNAIIFANFNQLYKIDPTTFRTWLRILDKVENSILWLLKFPSSGVEHLLRFAEQWASPGIAARIHFTDVAPKHLHIARGCVADLFLDTPECNAHTTAADCLWSGTPILTFPRYEWKMCSRMAAGILAGALPRHTRDGRQAWDELVVDSEERYEDAAVRLAHGLKYGAQRHGLHEWNGQGRLVELRKMIWEGRWTCPLFDTQRWVQDLEVAYAEAWRRWVAGEGGDIWLKDLL